jgi:DNA-binding NarL/FixJ family response regulator
VMERLREPRSAMLVDAHPLWLEALAPLVERAGMRVAAQLSSTTLALDQMAELKPDLLVTGIDMSAGEIDGLTLVSRARELHPPLKVVVLSGHDDQQHVDAAFAAGANAYVVKSAQPVDLISAFRQAFTHSVYLAGPRALTPPAPPRRSNGAAAGLTPRELEILCLVAEGHSNARLAETLWVTEQTVKFHLTNIYRKLNVANRTEASRWAQLNGLLPERNVGHAAA